MALRQFPTITGEGGRVSSRNRDLGTNGGTMDREIEAVDRPHQTLLASKEILYMSKQWTLVARIFIRLSDTARNGLLRESETVLHIFNHQHSFN